MAEVAAAMVVVPVAMVVVPVAVEAAIKSPQ
jgi:hypothetical protein